MPKPLDIEVDGCIFHGITAVVIHLQKHFGVGTRDGLQKAITRGASTYLGHTLVYRRKIEGLASTSEPETKKPWEPEHRYLGRPPLIRIRH